MALTYTLVRATPNQLVYAWASTGAEAGDLSFATMLADAQAGGLLKQMLTKLDGECNSDAKATSALITGEAFTGASGAVIQSDIQCDVVVQTATTAKAPPALTAADDGATNDPKLTITADAATAGWLRITRVHSIVA